MVDFCLGGNGTTDDIHELGTQAHRDFLFKITDKWYECSDDEPPAVPTLQPSNTENTGQDSSTAPAEVLQRELPDLPFQRQAPAPSASSSKRAQASTSSKRPQNSAPNARVPPTGANTCGVDNELSRMILKNLRVTQDVLNNGLELLGVSTSNAAPRAQITPQATQVPAQGPSALQVTQRPLNYAGVVNPTQQYLGVGEPIVPPSLQGLSQTEILNLANAQSVTQGEIANNYLHSRRTFVTVNGVLQATANVLNNDEENARRLYSWI